MAWLRHGVVAWAMAWQADWRAAGLVGGGRWAGRGSGSGLEKTYLSQAWAGLVGGREGEKGGDKPCNFSIPPGFSLCPFSLSLTTITPFSLPAYVCLSSLLSSLSFLSLSLLLCHLCRKRIPAYYCYLYHTYEKRRRRYLSLSTHASPSMKEWRKRKEGRAGQEGGGRGNQEESGDSACSCPAPVVCVG